MVNSQRRLDFKKYTQQIWLAGLGAFSKAEDESGRLFDSLVKRGAELEAKSNYLVEVGLDKLKSSQVLNFERNKQKDCIAQQTIKDLECTYVRELQELQKMVLGLHEKMDILMADTQDLRKEFDKK